MVDMVQTFSIVHDRNENSVLAFVLWDFLHSIANACISFHRCMDGGHRISMLP